MPTAQLPVETKGRIDVLGFKIFYRSFGDSLKGTILCLHGGPGLTHDYLLPMSDLASFGYRVILYDQLGCGESEVPKDQSNFTVEHYVEEVEGVRHELMLGRVHLFGSSFGGSLALAHALRYDDKLNSIITAGAMVNIPLTVAEMKALRSGLDQETQGVMRRYEDAGDYGSPEYLKALEVFYRRHLCRLPEWPPELVNSLTHASGPVLSTMLGPNPFVVIGNMRNWDIEDQLTKVHIPCLITCGRYDEITPRIAKRIHGKIRGSKLKIFENSSHLPMLEEREKYTHAVRDFLDELT